MRRLFIVFLVAGCSKGPQADLQYISQARSLGAEWASVNQQAIEGRLTNPYVHTMRQSVRKQIRSAQTALTMPGSEYDREMERLLNLPADAPPPELLAHAERLQQIEDSLKSD